MDKSRLPSRDKLEKTLWEKSGMGAVVGAATRAARDIKRGRKVKAKRDPRKAGGYTQSKQTRKEILDKYSEQ